MHYGKRSSRDSIPRVVPLLFATGSLGLLTLVWRRLAAPRREARRHGGAANAHELPAQPRADDPEMQSLRGGAGEIFHRRYEVVLTASTISSRDVMQLMQRHLAELAPSMLARFEKMSGADGPLRVGDEYDITMLGPWNGVVRVCDSSAESFTLVTLDGHPEAGHITFSVAAHGSDQSAVCVRIESWARARDSVVAVAYGTLGIGKQVQTEVWVTFLQRLGAMAGMREKPEVQITTEQLPLAAADDVEAQPTYD